MRRAHRWRWMASLGFMAMILGVLALIGLGAAVRSSWGDPAGPVWYYGRLVPIGELLARGVEPKCHDGLGPGILTCYDTNEELAAATGLDLPRVDPARVQRLRETMPASTSGSAGTTSVPVWYYGQLLPLRELIEREIQPHCHDGRGPGVITCYNTNEELAAATGLDLPGVDRARVEQLRQSGAVVPVACAYYAVLWEHAHYGGRNFALCYDYNDLRSVYFNDIASSIFMPSGAGVSTFFELTNFEGDWQTFNVSIPDLQFCSFDDRISSARRGR
ncbi:MAG: beta/gamma crystallin family protein [Thermoflexus sp.]|nr:beta/gamma crystallin family protein [Thermoflexus sp.]